MFGNVCIKTPFRNSRIQISFSFKIETFVDLLHLSITDKTTQSINKMQLLSENTPNRARIKVKGQWQFVDFFFLIITEKIRCSLLSGLIS